MKKYLLFGFIFAITLCGGVVFADTSTGFIPGQIWYSKQPLIEGDTVDVHTIVWNGDTNSLSATVEFYDKNVILGSRNIVIPSKTSKDVSVSWKITAGDHLISASIISSKITTGGTSKSITLDHRLTSGDKQFVSKVVETIDGVPVSSGDIIKSKVLETTSQIDNIIPNSIGTPVSNAFSSIDDFRSQTSDKIESSKIETQKKIDELNGTSATPVSSTKKVTNSKTTTPTSKDITKKETGVSGTEKPIALVKLFFLSVAGFIFCNKIVFYGLIIIIVFFILRFIYRKIRGR